MNIKNIQQSIIKLDFSNAYEELVSLNYNFCFENIVRDFNKVDSIKMYAFMMYAISQKEDIIKHISICNCLYFINPYVNGADQIIRWHILRALELFPNSASIVGRWVVDIYDGNPDCPFSDDEMYQFKNDMKVE